MILSSWMLSETGALHENTLKVQKGRQNGMYSKGFTQGIYGKMGAAVWCPDTPDDETLAVEGIPFTQKLSAAQRVRAITQRATWFHLDVGPNQVPQPDFTH